MKDASFARSLSEGFHRARRNHRVWKVLQDRNTGKRKIVQLLLKKGTTFYAGSMYSWNPYRKCRAVCLTTDDPAFDTCNFGSILDTVQYKYGPVYPKNKKILRPFRPFSKDTTTCASGIHFFFSKQECRAFSRVHT